MDGLKKQPLECAEYDKASTMQTWIDVVRPALRGRMDVLSTGGDIRFNLLALVPCAYQTKMDDFELGKREVIFLERRLKAEFGDTWEVTVRASL
jgi:ubiquitin carboxyl-terminal hydrolase L5